MRKQKRNISISLLLISVMLLSAFAGTGITVAAENLADDTIEAVDITIPEDLLLAGKAYTSAENSSLITVTSGNCTLESIKMQGPSGAELDDGTRLSYKDEYAVVIKLKANGSYKFTENATVRVNGSESGVRVVNRYQDGDDKYRNLELTLTFTPTVKEYINAFSLSDVPQATLGAAAVPYSYTHTVNGDEQYTVSGSWHQYNSTTQQYEPMADTDVFQNNGAYKLMLHTEMKPGYVSNNDEPLYVTVNGVWVGVDYSGEFEWEAGLYESFGTEIHEVSFTVQQPTEGQPFSNTVPITATVPLGSKYTVKGNWVEEESGSYTGSFTKGNVYYFEYTVYADDGYYFAQEVAVHINGMTYAAIACNGKTGSGTYRRSMKTPITEVILTNVPKAESGKTLQIGEFALTVPVGAKYKAIGYWNDESGHQITNGQIEAGKEYELWIDLEAEPGYEFAESYILKINGAAHQSDGGDASVLYRVRYSFLEQIRQIEVVGMVEPVVGEAADTTSLMPADPTKYTIFHAYWIDLATGIPATVFEDGHAYDLTVDVKALSGYEFAPNVSWKLGKESGKGEPYAFAWCRMNTEYSFAEVVSEIRIDNIPTVNVGEVPQTNIKISADANYTAYAEWRVWNDRTDMWEVFTGAFERGKNYIMAISVLPEAGYSFDPDVTAYYLNGKLHKEARIRALQAWVEVLYAPEDAEVIRKVEITVSKPTGGDHSSVDPVITLPDGVNYRLRDGFVWLEGSIEEDVIFTDRYFEANGSYGVNFRLIANDGYVFADDMQVVVNGIMISSEVASSVKTLDVDYFFNMTCRHIEGNAATCTQKAVCAVCGQEYGELADHTYVDGKCVCGKNDPGYTQVTEPDTDVPGTDGPTTDKPDTDGLGTTPETNGTDPGNSGEPSDKDGGLGAGAIAGVAVGSAVAVGLGGFSLFWFVIKKKKWIDLIGVFKK